MELFLLIGQSNMAGRGIPEAQDKAIPDRVFSLNRELTWVPATDPLHFDKPEVVGVGPGSGFAKFLAARDSKAVIGLIPAAFGGSALNEWKPGSKHYTNAVTRAKKAMERGHLAGILWHQGESDSGADLAASYATRFLAMITQLRQDLGDPDLPVVVGETGRFRKDATAINAVLAELPKTVPHCAFVSAEGLKDKGDKLHFDAASQRELGRRYAEAWLTLTSDGKKTAGPKATHE